MWGYLHTQRRKKRLLPTEIGKTTTSARKAPRKRAAVGFRWQDRRPYLCLYHCFHLYYSLGHQCFYLCLYRSSATTPTENKFQRTCSWKCYKTREAVSLKTADFGIEIPRFIPTFRNVLHCLISIENIECKPTGSRHSNA
ncbi:hypothetical protein LSAT2_027604 [Lamellibrachia satsuma]|nr:hypothetical protein LSAT2_027604 [Lamellibrachia satsuma]